MRFARAVAGFALKTIGEVTWLAVTGSFADIGPTNPPGKSNIPNRRTTSACPWCHAKALGEVLDGAMDERSFEGRSPYLIPAEIVHRDGQIWMQKTCPEHGLIEDLLSSDAAFTERIESLYRPQEPSDQPTLGARRHASGLMLVIDLTNRCNMKCSPCFMDANHQPYVREASIEDVRHILERATAARTRRHLDILFSGGEPTIAPAFIECLELARGLGFGRLHVATNGIRFAQEDDFARKAKDAGLHGVFLQLDGVSNQANAHRGVDNLFDTKLLALKRIRDAGLNVILQATVANNLNNTEAGRLVEFAVEHIDGVHSVLFQPIVFTGRDRLPTDQYRRHRRYTLAQLAHDLSAQSEFDWQPLRDWFPISASGAFGNLLDALDLEVELRSPAHDLHAMHGQFSVLLVDTETRWATPLSAFFQMDRFLRDATAIGRHDRSRHKVQLLLVASVLRNLSLECAPRGLGIRCLGALFKQLAARLKKSGKENAAKSRWRFLTINAVWFEDPFNVDFEAACRSCAPVATEEGEFSFCAYNSMGWRQIVERRHRTVSLADWHRQNGRHAIYANGATVPLDLLNSRPQSAIEDSQDQCVAAPRETPS